MFCYCLGVGRELFRQDLQEVIDTLLVVAGGTVLLREVLVQEKKQFLEYSFHVVVIAIRGAC